MLALNKKMKYTTDEYIAAFRQLNIAPHHKKMLQAHYHAPNRTLTPTQMSKAIGYLNFNASNLHYGKLGKLVGEKLGWSPTKKESQGGVAVYILAEIEQSGQECLWIMRPQVAQAIEKLELIAGNYVIIPEEVEEASHLYADAVRSISVNAYERSIVAREKCILHHSCKCSICEVNLADIYGEIAHGHIHVHHLRQLSEVNAKYQVDPIHDLRPVCPNCHAIIHMKKPPFTIEEIKSFIKNKKTLIG